MAKLHSFSEVLKIKNVISITETQIKWLAL